MIRLFESLWQRYGLRVSWAGFVSGLIGFILSAIYLAFG
jgi:hypothetical protein